MKKSLSCLLTVGLAFSCGACSVDEDGLSTDLGNGYPTRGMTADGGLPAIDAQSVEVTAPDATVDLEQDTKPSTPDAVVPVSDAIVPVLDALLPPSLAIQRAPDDLESQASLVIAGSDPVVIGKWQLIASNGAASMPSLSFIMKQASAARSVLQLSLYDGAVLLAGPIPVSGVAQMTFSVTGFTVPKNAFKTITLKASLKTIASGAVSGDDLLTSLYLTDAPNTKVPGNSKIVHKTEPVISLAPLPTTVLQGFGNVVLYRFSLTARPTEDVSLEKLSFAISIMGGGTISHPAIREVGSGSPIPANTTLDDAGGTDCGFTATLAQNCLRLVFANEQITAAGTSRTYELRISTMGFGQNSSIGTTFLGEVATATGPLSVAPDRSLGVQGTPCGFVWSDNAAIPHTDNVNGSSDWICGGLVKGLPGAMQTLTY